MSFLRRLNRSLYLLLALPLATLLLAACGGLAGEPDIIATIPSATRPPQETGYPLQPPDLARGAQVYAANCTRCHGLGGASDGELVLSGEVPAMASFTDPATARSQTPQQWFTTITDGRLDKLMPPWRTALSEQDRWNVALYTYTMAYTPEQIAQGQTIWQAECAECHGETGLGDGPEAANINRPIGNLTEQTEIVTYSDQNLYTIVTEGQGENMPAFADELTEDERWAAVAYARLLTVANADMIGQEAPSPAATPDPETTAEAGALGTVSGRVTNGTAASSVPADLQITLLSSAFQAREGVVNAGGTFTFTDVPIVSGAQYAVATVYRERVFTSEFVVADGTSTALDLPVTIYELTEDPAVITIGGIVAQVSAVGDALQIQQVFRFTNASDRVYTTSNNIEENIFASLVLSLPPGAQVIGFDTDGRYQVSQEDFAIIDTAPVFPGDEHLIVVIYILPYDGGLSIIEQAMNYPVDGQVRLLMYPETLTVASQQLPLLGPETLGSRTYQAYGASMQLQPGDVIRYEVSGAAVSASEGNETTDSQSSLLPVLLALIGVCAIVVGVLLYLRTRVSASANNPQVLIDALVRQIAELDDAHASGQLNHDLWHRQRAQLKARLAELLGEEKEG